VTDTHKHTHGQMDRHTTTAYAALSIASPGKNSQLYSQISKAGYNLCHKLMLKAKAAQVISKL